MTTEETLSVPAPSISSAQAVELACERYGLGPAGDVQAKALPGEYDHNFEITTADQRRFVLKIMHPARASDLVELQCEALEHLSRSAPDLALPRVQQTTSGDRWGRARLGDSDAGARLFWMLSFVEGTPFAEVRPRTAEMFESLGRFMGAIDRGLADFQHSAARRDLKWDLSRAGWIEASISKIDGVARQSVVSRVLALFKSTVQPALPHLRRGVIHSDANDHNVIITAGATGSRQVASVIDFGDMHHGLLAAEVAIAATYALLGDRDPLKVAAAVTRGYHAAHPLEEREVALLFPLILARLAVSVTNSAIMTELKPNDPYMSISEKPAWEALERLLRITPEVAEARLRQACGWPAIAGAREVVSWLVAQRDSMASVLDHDLRSGPSLVFDLSVASPLLGADPRATETAALTETLFKEMRQAGVSVGVGRYDEARLLYISPLFGPGEAATDERRTIHLGIDLFVEPGSRVRAPLDGVVHLVTNNDAPQDYGPLVVLKHQTDQGLSFFTLFGHLSDDTLHGVREGQTVRKGEEIARVGSPPSNGDWAPHLHFQIILDLLELGRDFPGVCRASERSLWTEVSPDPNLILGIPAERFGTAPPTPEATLAKRREVLGPNLRLSYRHPLKIVRGWSSWLYDETGRAYLDMYNNVPLVGHNHPRVVRAIREQLGLLNTNTRYLHDSSVRYAQRLTDLLPDPLRICYFVNSGSEANELALRLARAHTGRQDIIVLENAYHGHTTSLIEISPYKFNGPGGSGRRDFVHVAPMPDDYRGRHLRSDPEAGLKFGREVGDVVDRILASGRSPGAFIAETLPSVGGQIVPPPGYLAEAYRQIRRAGGVAIADEVQVGFGRLGTHFWGFQMLGAVPDIVVLGKPIGNGFPLGAVITTEEIARSFDNGMEFFSTFGGSPVACAAGLAVLDVVRDESLQSRALETGTYLRARLQDLMAAHPIIGDVRGAGLFLSIELIRDRSSLEPATAQAKYVSNRLRELGVLTGTDGPFENVLKLRPPLVLTRDEADLFVARLDEVLSEDESLAPFAAPTSTARVARRG